MSRVDVSKCTVIIPAYNEASRIHPVVVELDKHFSSIVIVDDNSDDNLAGALENFSKIIILRHPTNCGQGAALKTGMSYVSTFLNSEFIITFDADGQHLVGDAIEALKVAESGCLDGVLGSRFLVKRSQIPITKKVLLRIAVRLNRSARILNLTDLHNGLRVLRLSKFEDLNMAPGMSHADDIIAFIASKKLQIKECPMTINYDIKGKKSQSLFNGVNILIERLLIK